MAKDESIYLNELANFRKTYNMPKYDLKTRINTENMFKYLNGTDARTPAQQYVKLLTQTMATHFELATALRDSGAPSLKGFKLSQFAEDFEKLFDAGYRSELENADDYARQPRNGASKKAISQACHAYAKSFSKTLPTLWKENVRKGDMKIDTMQATTDSLFQKLTAPDADKEALRGELSHLVAAHEAMKQVRESRNGFIGFFWKLFHKDQNAQEEQYSQNLQEKINELQAKGYAIADVTDELTGTTMLGETITDPNKLYRTTPIIGESKTPPKAQEAKPKKEEKPKPKKEAKKKTKKEEPKSKDLPGKVPNKEAAMELMKDKAAMSKDLLGVVGDYGDSFLKDIMKDSLSTNIKSYIKTAWNDFDKASDPAQKEAVIKDFACQTFRILYGSTISNISGVFNTPVEKMVMTQKMTDYIMNTYSPAASNTKYAQFGDNYYLKNTDLETVMQNTFFTDNIDEVKQAVDQAKLERGIGKVPLDMSKDFREGSTKTTDKIKETEAPTKDKTRDF